jgi:hypothetical protein
MPGMDTLSPTSPDAFQEHTTTEGVEVGGVPLGTSLELLSKMVGDMAFAGALGNGQRLQSEEVLIVAHTKCSGCTDGCDTGRCV